MEKHKPSVDVLVMQKQDRTTVTEQICTVVTLPKVTTALEAMFDALQDKFAVEVFLTSLVEAQIVQSTEKPTAMDNISVTEHVELTATMERFEQPQIALMAALSMVDDLIVIVQHVWVNFTRITDVSEVDLSIDATPQPITEVQYPTAPVGMVATTTTTVATANVLVVEPTDKNTVVEAVSINVI